MTSPRSGLPEESAATSPAGYSLVEIAARYAEGWRIGREEVGWVLGEAVALSALAADRDETIKALRAELERWQEIKRRVLEAGGDLL